MPRRVGSLDHAAARYGARSLAVYEKQSGGGFFFLLDKQREPVHGNQRWTKLDGTSMRGNVPLGAAGAAARRPHRRPAAARDGDDGSDGPDSDDGEAWRGAGARAAEEARQLALAIAASLRDRELPQPAASEPAAEAEEPTEAEEPASAPAAEPRACVICMTATPDHVFKPCGHLCLCAGCAVRVRRDRLACPVCRRPQRAIERVFHA